MWGRCGARGGKIEQRETRKTSETFLQAQRFITEFQEEKNIGHENAELKCSFLNFNENNYIDKSYEW